MRGIDKILLKVKFGHLGTVDSEGKPYVIPLAFNYVDGSIYIHVAERGKKIDNIRRNPYVCFEAASLDPSSSMLRSEGRPLDFASVIVGGKAEKVTDEAEKIKAFGEAGLRGAAYKIKPEEITGRKKG